MTWPPPGSTTSARGTPTTPKGPRHLEDRQCSLHAQGRSPNFAQSGIATLRDKGQRGQALPHKAGLRRAPQYRQLEPGGLQVQRDPRTRRRPGGLSDLGQEQKRRCHRGSYNPTLETLYEDEEVLGQCPSSAHSTPPSPTPWRCPSAVTGDSYGRVSNAFFDTTLRAPAT
ncbi:hypothetical protein DSL92_01575 [Billgrantia gudaonensis]|uniref:Uncharacterized protein n=1 Tax=Billgrantia gudaonensis TaxID=376427 RepID=A0A3S0QS90_9GAMM|nr:hypothetical protein DSL92_01575 [Halomonas gudaonensis]